MTVEELASHVHEAKASGRKHLYLSVDRLPRGERMRVMPGVMGEVMSVNQQNRTNVLVQVADVERALKRAEIGGA